jgi:hypothetical protein
MTAMKSYADDSASPQIGDLTIENGTDHIAVYGSLDLTRDKAGLESARALKRIVDAALKVLEGDKNLPDRIAPPKKPEQVKNPFA